MLVITLILVAFSVLIFALKAFRPAAFTDIEGISLGLAFGFGGIGCWILDILHARGTL